MSTYKLTDTDGTVLYLGTDTDAFGAAADVIYAAGNGVTLDTNPNTDADYVFRAITEIPALIGTPSASIPPTDATAGDCTDPQCVAEDNCQCNTPDTTPFVRTTEIGGTYLRGYITATFAELTAAFGAPDPGEDGKTRVEWRMKFGNAVATVYDWKTTEPVEEVTHWNVGGSTPQAVELVEAALHARR